MNIMHFVFRIYLLIFLFYIFSDMCNENTSYLYQLNFELYIKVFFNIDI